MTSYIDNIKSKHIIDIDTILFPHIDKKIEYGIFYQAGAGGAFLTSCLLANLEKNDSYWSNSTSNEYHIINDVYQFFSFVDKRVVSNKIFNAGCVAVFKTQDEANTAKTKNLLKVLEKEFYHIMQNPIHVCVGQWAPLILLSQSNIKIKHLLYIKYGQWLPTILLDIKRKGISGVFLNTTSLEQIINHSNHDMQVNENYSLNYLKTSKQIETLEVKEYDQLFFDLECDLPIPKKKIAEYSFRNLDLIETIADRTMNNTSLKDEFKHNVLNEYKNRLNNAVKCLNV